MNPKMTTTLMASMTLGVVLAIGAGAATILVLPSQHVSAASIGNSMAEAAFKVMPHHATPAPTPEAQETTASQDSTQVQATTADLTASDPQRESADSAPAAEGIGDPAFAADPAALGDLAGALPDALPGLIGALPALLPALTGDSGGDSPALPAALPALPDALPTLLPALLPALTGGSDGGDGVALITGLAGGLFGGQLPNFGAR